MACVLLRGKIYFPYNCLIVFSKLSLAFVEEERARLALS